MRLSTDRRIAGRARTLRYLPAREDAKPPAAGVNRKLIETLEPGEVVVTETGGLLEGAVLGDMLAARAFARGAAGLVTDGVVRDIEGIREVGLPVWARGTFPDSNVSYSIPWDSDIAIRCGGTLVLPGDFILADTDAAMVVPPSHVEAMLARAEMLAIEDIFSQNLLRAGVPLDDAYPIPASRREEYERFAAEHKGKKA
jgi:regulator of RNase E activity RraA